MARTNPVWWIRWSQSVGFILDGCLSDRNIKITKPSDLPLARLYIAQERELVQSDV